MAVAVKIEIGYENGERIRFRCKEVKATVSGTSVRNFTTYRRWWHRHQLLHRNVDRILFVRRLR